MPKFKEADFYYGAVLSALFNNGICPMLLEGGTDRQVYDFTTDDAEFRLFVKYRSEGRAGAKDGYTSWTFIFSADDVTELKKYIADREYLSLGLVCSMKQFNDSEYVVLHKEEILGILDAGKNSLTVSRKKGEKAFRISMGGGRENAMQVPSNRLY